MRKFRLYFYSPETLKLWEFKWGRTRLGLFGLIVGVAGVFALLRVNERYSDVLGLGFARPTALLAENRLLKDQLRSVMARIGGLEKRLASINDLDNELRLRVNLPRIDEDIRRAGTGGVDEHIDFSTSADVNNLLNDLRASVSRAEREASLQITSYEEVSKTHDRNLVKWAHYPAIRPMDGFYSKKGIGVRLHPVLNIYRRHEGLDIANDVGTPVYAAAEGMVDFAGRDGGYGLMVEVNHGYSLKTLYAHLSKVLAREGQHVKRGDVIGRSGNTGLSSGPHLHYEVRINGVAQNPRDFFFDDVDPEEYVSESEASK